MMHRLLGKLAIPGVVITGIPLCYYLTLCIIQLFHHWRTGTLEEPMLIINPFLEAIFWFGFFGGFMALRDNPPTNRLIAWLMFLGGLLALSVPLQLTTMRLIHGRHTEWSSTLLLGCVATGLGLLAWGKTTYGK